MAKHMFPDLDRSDSRIYSRVIAITAIVNWLLVLWVFNATRYLRPVADDYCIGVRGDLGVIGGFLQDFQTFSGFATPSFLTNLFVGIPLARGPLWLASATTFIVASIAIALLSVTLFLISNGGQQSTRTVLLRILVVAPIGLVGWWTFLWFPLESFSSSPMDNLAIGLTHWQNLNSAYVLPTALILSAGIFVLRPSIASNAQMNIARAILGLIVGLMGPTFGLAAFGFLFLMLAWSLISSTRFDPRSLITYGALFTGVFAGLLIAYLSPGTQARAAYYDAADVTFSPDSIVGWVMGVVPENLLLFGELVFHWGSLAIVALFLGLGFFAQKRISEFESAKFLPIALGITVFGISLMSATIVTDTFAYGAYWHSSSIAVVAYAGCASFGVWVGGKLATQSGELPVVTAALLVLAGISAGIGSSLELSSSITLRESQWSRGPAPIVGIIEDRDRDWIGDCADQLALVNPAFDPSG